MNYINAFLFTEITCQPTRLNETKLNKLANICFSPLHYWKGRTIQFSLVSLSSFNNGNKWASRAYSPHIILDELRQETSRTWIKTLLTIALIVPAILIGSIFKGLSLLDQRTRGMVFIASLRHTNQSQKINKSTIYLPASSSIDRKEFRLLQDTIVNGTNINDSTASIRVSKNSPDGCPFGVVIHYKGKYNQEKNRFAIQLTNPTELTEARRSIWGRVTYPIQHNFTSDEKLIFEDSTEFSFIGELLSGTNENGKMVTCTETDTTTQSTTRIASITDALVKKREKIDRKWPRDLPRNASEPDTYVETNHAFQITIPKHSDSNQ